jgi:acetolactate synthase regulatory subunit
MSDAVTTAPAAQPSARRPVKVPRDRIVTLAVETDPCPQALLRVLGLIAQHGSEPMSIAAERRADGQRITVEIGALPDAGLSTLVAKIEAIVTVRSAAFMPPGASASR